MKIVQKQDWITYLRVFATIAVILIHVVASILNKYEEIPIEHWWIGNIYDSIVRCSVPLFFMISGALLLSKDYELEFFIKKRFLRIIPPFLFWSFIYIAYDLYFHSDGQLTFLGVSKTITQSLLKGSQFHLWFVYAILGLYLFVPILRRWVKAAPRKEILFFLIIWFLTLLAKIPFVKPFFPKIDLVNFTGYLGYFVLGYYLLQVPPKRKFMPAMLIFLGLIVTIFGTYWVTESDGSFSSVFYKYLSPNVLMVSIGVFLIMRTVSISNVRLNKVLSFISSNSFGIYLVHVLVLYFLRMVGVDWTIFNPLVSVPLVTIICLLISAGIIALLKTTKWGTYIAG